MAGNMLSDKSFTGRLYHIEKNINSPYYCFLIACQVIPLLLKTHGANMRIPTLVLSNQHYSDYALAPLLKLLKARFI